MSSDVAWINFYLPVRIRFPDPARCQTIFTFCDGNWILLCSQQRQQAIRVNIVTNRRQWLPDVHVSCVFQRSVLFCDFNSRPLRLVQRNRHNHDRQLLYIVIYIIIVVVVTILLFGRHGRRTSTPHRGVIVFGPYNGIASYYTSCRIIEKTTVEFMIQKTL